MAEKSSDAFRTISEVADDLNVPQHVLRFWEGRFPQIKPMKRAGGRRYYRPEDIELLGRIRDLLYTQGYTIKGVQNLLKDGIDADTASDASARPSQPQNQPELSVPQQPSFMDLAAAVSTVTETAAMVAPPPAPLPAPLEPMMGDLLAPTEVVISNRTSPVEPVFDSPQPFDNTGLSPEVRAQLEGIVDELEQLRFLLRAQD